MCYIHMESSNEFKGGNHTDCCERARLIGVFRKVVQMINVYGEQINTRVIKKISHSVVGY